MSCSGSACTQDHDHTKPEDAYGDSLFQYIDTTKVRVLNASDDNDRNIPFRPYHLRHERDACLSSNDDDCGQEGTHPRDMNLFVNREDIDFTNVYELPPSQHLELAEDYDVTIDYPLQQRKFQGVNNITLFISDNYGGPCSSIYYIGFKGLSQKWKHGVVEAVYESRALLSDHKVPENSYQSYA